MPPDPGPPPPVVPVAGVDDARSTAERVVAGIEATIERAATSFSEQERQHGVNDEWSTVESLRHIVLLVDVWLSRAIVGEEDPFHAIALPPSFMPPKLPGSSIDPEARPTFDEACEVVRGRLERVRRYVADLTPADLDRPVANHARTVAGALGVLFKEFEAHTSFMNRDLDVIEAGRPPG